MVEPALVIAVLAVAFAAIVIALYERELRHLARFFERRDPSSNERAGVGFSTPGMNALAGALNASLEKQDEAAAAATDHARAFRRDLSSLSHDIRTPLAGAQGYLQLFDHAESDEERTRCLSEANARLAAMRELTDQLFDHAKAADPDQELTLAPVEVLPVLAEVLAALYPDFHARGLSCTVSFDDEHFTARADAEALSRAFSNLAANALRHGTGALRIEQHGSCITFANTVEDAAAIDPARLFERFYRADAARTGTGSGLGLSIVAHLCEKMGIAVRADVRNDELAITLDMGA